MKHVHNQVTDGTHAVQPILGSMLWLTMAWSGVNGPVCARAANDGPCPSSVQMRGQTACLTTIQRGTAADMPSASTSGHTGVRPFTRDNMPNPVSTANRPSLCQSDKVLRCYAGPTPSAAEPARLDKRDTASPKLVWQAGATRILRPTNMSFCLLARA